MTAVNELKWVLEKLMEALERELKQEGQKNMEQEGRINGGSR